jgi:polyphosphate kinase 2 (PPK2 family)
MVLAHRDKQDVLPMAVEEVDGNTYREALLSLQIELVKLQREIMGKGFKILVLFEGRDAAGKDGTIKRITEHLSPRETRTVALGTPSDRDRKSWCFQRYVPHLPAAQEMVLFNRSWYNRAGVERVMGFCTRAEYHEFMETVPVFEQMLERAP